MNRPTQRFTIAIGATLAAGIALPAAGQDDPMSFAELAKYRGPDRQEILLEGAREEGRVVYYTAYVQRIVDGYIDLWEEMYPDIELEVIVATDQATGTRVITEYQAGLHAVDVISSSGTTQEINNAIGSQAFSSPYLDEYPVGELGRAPDDTFVALTYLPRSFGYNTNLVDAEDVPTEWDDLLSERWEDNLVVTTSPSMLPMMTGGLLEQWGRDRTLEYMTALAEQDVTILPVTVSAIASMVAAGEYDGCYCSVHHLTALQREGAPIGIAFVGDTLFAQVHTLQLPPHPPHPHAALLLADFLLSAEAGAQVQRETGYFPTNPEVFAQNQDLANRQSWVMSPEMLEASGDDWRALLSEAGFDN